MNHWRKTYSAMKKFQNLPEKIKSKFLKLDIIDFYYTTKIILYNQKARKSPQFNSDNQWMKMIVEIFDVAMAWFDEREICELAGLYLLDRFASVFGKEKKKKQRPLAR